MDNKLRLELDELCGILTDAKVGYWKADFDKKMCYLSEYMAELIENESGEISFDYFFELVREDYRTRIMKEFKSLEYLNIYDQTFPIYSKYGFTWVHSRLSRKIVNDDGSILTFGVMQCIPNPEEECNDKMYVQRVNNLLYQQNSISYSLLTFLQTEDTISVVEKILGDILKQFRGGRAYIFEFDLKNGFQSCTYEVVEKGVSKEKESLQNLPLDASTWWAKQLLANKPITLFSLDELPEDALYDREVLEMQGINSVMAIPMLSREGVWGFMGIDIVEGYRHWSNEDYQWFASMTNITNICLELRRSELEAKRDRIFLSNLYRFMPVGYIRMKVIFDEMNNPVDYLFVDINEMADKILGVGKCIGKLGSRFGQGFDNSLKNIKQILDTESYLELNFQVDYLDKYCHSILYALGREEIVCMFSDMTETFKTHEALDRSEKMLRSIYNNLPVGIELYDENGYLIDFNDKNLEIFGVEDKAEIMHLNLFENIRFSEEIREGLRRKEKLDFSYNYEFSKQQWHTNSRNKGSVNLITKMTPIYDSQNRFSNYLVINIDNTETTSAYRKIQEFEEYFSVIADFAKVGYFKWNPITNEGFAISQWYKNVREPENLKLKDIVGKYRNYHPDDRKAMNDFFQQSLLGQAHDLSREVRVIQPDGSWRWLRCNIMVKEYDPGHDIIEMVGVNFDITELKETEEKLIVARDKAEALDHLKSAFLANMSHEIRTPLNAIVGFSNLLIDTEDIEEKRQYIAIVQKNNDLLLQLISDILDLSKIESGTFDFVEDNVDINALCEEIVCSFNTKGQNKIQIQLGAHLPECKVYSDRIRLTQIISNFITNALKFTSNGSITLSYRLTASNEVEFSVTDTGIGIPQEKQEAIFGRFVKLDSFVNGTGLGLSICKSIAEQMGGRIGVESEVGMGSRFWFTHPYMKIE